MGHAAAGRNHRAQTGDWHDRHRGTPAGRDAYRQARDDIAHRVAVRLGARYEMDGLAGQIRPLMAKLRACGTPAERAKVEAELRPLVRARQALMSWTI
jgi:hypothetical protein